MEKEGRDGQKDERKSLEDERKSLGDERKSLGDEREDEDGRHTHVLGLVRRDEPRDHLDEGLLNLEPVVLCVAALRRVSASSA
jgi:hypothetical protein